MPRVWNNLDRNNMFVTDPIGIIGETEAAKMLEQKGFRIVNIDATVCAQKPKLAPHIKHMRFNIARACGIDMSQVSIKATTEEGLGFTGNLEGISATAVCLVNERNFGFFGAFSGNVPFLR